MSAHVLRIAGLTLPRPARPLQAWGRPVPLPRPAAAPRAARSLAALHRDGGCTRYRFDEGGRLKERTAAAGGVLRYRYDAAGRLAAAIQPDGSETEFRYDDAGRLAARLDASRREHRFTYDERGRLAEVCFGPDHTVRAAYDGAGRLMALDEPEVALRIERTESGALAAFERTIGGLRFRIRTDARGEALTIELPDGTEIDLAAEPAARPLADLLPPRLDERGNAVGLPDPDSGVETEARYDACDRLLEVRGPRAAIRYDYDLAGNRILREDADGATRYSYDDRHRLRLLQKTRGTEGEVSFAWDDAGRLIERCEAGAAEARARATSYVWDAAGQLAEVRRDGVVVARFLSDFEGRTVRRLAPDCPGAPDDTTRIYLRDLGGRLLAVMDGSGRLLAAFPPRDEGRAAIVPGRGRLRLDLDHLGSTRAIRGLRGEILWRGDYSPFGRLLGPAPDFPCPLFGGYLGALDLGLWDAGARFYDPGLGRFLSPDPWTGGPDDARLLAAGCAVVPPAWLARPLEVHPYAFCRNNPLSFRDPEGLSGWGIFGKVLLSIFWGSVWTLLGLSLTILDWIVQFVLFGWAYLPRYGIDGVSSGRLGTAAMINVGGLGPSPLVLSNVLFARRGLVDDLDDTRLEYIIPTEADRTPRVLRTAKTAYFEHLLAHTVQALYTGPFWPFVYLFGSDWAEKDATLESGFPTEAFPVAAIAPKKILTSRGTDLVVVGGPKPYTATLSNAAAGALQPIQDRPRFSEAHLAPLYAPGDYTITVRDSAGISDVRSFEIAELRVSDVDLISPPGLRLYDDISDPAIPTIRLLDGGGVARAQASLDIEVGPRGGELFCEPVNPVPANPAPLSVIPTTSIGDTRIFVTLTNAPTTAVPEDHLLQIRAWNQQGTVLKRLRFRALQPITVILQPHVVRDTAATDPAVQPARMAEILVATNRLWVQAGIQFQWRTNPDGTIRQLFVDNTPFRDIRLVHVNVAQVNSPEADNMFAWVPAGTPPFAAGADHNTTDAVAIHVWWIDDFENPQQPGANGGRVLAFANRAGNYLVLPRTSSPMVFAHEIGHNLGLRHPDQAAPAPSQAGIRVMFSSADPSHDFIANEEPARAAAPGGNDETVTARARAATLTGP